MEVPVYDPSDRKRKSRERQCDERKRSRGREREESKERSEGESIEKAGWLNSITKVTSSQLSSLLLRASYPLPPLYFDSPYSLHSALPLHLVSLPFSLHFYYDEPSSPLFRSHPLPSRRGTARLLALLFLLQTFPFRRRDTVLICKERTVDNIKEKWRASRWGQRTRARWPDRSWGTSERGAKVTGMREIDIRRRGGRDSWRGSERRKEAKPVTYEMEMTVSCIAQFLLFLTNLILSREYQVIESLHPRCGRTWSVTW